MNFNNIIDDFKHNRGYQPTVSMTTQVIERFFEGHYTPFPKAYGKLLDHAGHYPCPRLSDRANTLEKLHYCLELRYLEIELQAKLNNFTHDRSKLGKASSKYYQKWLKHLADFFEATRFPSLEKMALSKEFSK